MSPVGAKEHSWFACLCKNCKPRTIRGTKDRIRSRAWKRAEREQAKKEISQALT